MAITTAKHHPQVISSQSPDARKIVWLVAARPDWFSAETAIATTPSPNAISTKQPRNSERNSPQTVLRQAAPAPMLTYQTPFVPVASVAVSDTSTSLFRTSGFQKVRLRGGRIAVLACRTLRVSDSAGSPAARCSAGINAPGCAVSSGTNARAYRARVATSVQLGQTSTA